MSLGCAQKQRHPHMEGVGPKMLSPAGHIEKRPHMEGVGLAMLSPAGLTEEIMATQACAVKATHRDPRFAGGERCRA
jgi:hypothetical protein